MTENVPAKRSPVELMFEQAKPAMMAVLPGKLTGERMMRIALSAIRINPDLRKCTPASVVGAILQSCKIGLELNTPLGHAYLVPYKSECTLIIGYKGMLHLAYQNPRILAVRAHLVREQDRFEWQAGTEERIVHIPLLPERNAGSVVGAYAIIDLDGGGHITRYMSIEEILRARPGHWQKTPWNDPKAADEMILKTVIRRAIKLAPIGEQLATAIAADEASTRGAHYTLDTETDQAVLIEDAQEIEAEPIEAPVDIPTPTRGKRPHVAGQTDMIGDTPGPTMPE